LSLCHGSPDDARDLVWFLDDLTPGEAQNGPPAHSEFVLPNPVAFEGQIITMERATIDLNRYTAGHQCKVDFCDHSPAGIENRVVGAPSTHT